MQPANDQTTQYSPEFDNDYQQRSDSKNLIPLVIRRHIPGSTDPVLHRSTSPTLSNARVNFKENQSRSNRYMPASQGFIDPTLQQFSSPSPPDLRVNFKENPSRPHRYTPVSRGSTDPTSQPFSSPTPPNVPVTIKRNPSQPNRHKNNVRIHSPVSSHPDDRPIKPMKDTSVYQKPPALKNATQPRKPLSPPKPVKPSPRFESESFQPPPSRSEVIYSSARRPVRTDLIPRTPFGIPSQRRQPRKVIVEEYYDDVDDYPVTYVKPVPKQVVSYKEVPGMTTREMENYQMSKVRRVIHGRPPPRGTIIYRT